MRRIRMRQSHGACRRKHLACPFHQFGCYLTFPLVAHEEWKEHKAQCPKNPSKAR
jgi:hypothetical protein